MSWHYTAYRTRSMVKLKSLCVINHIAMMTYGGVDRDPTILSFEMVSFTSDRFNPDKEPQASSG